jgi:hypothetical protein
VKKKEEESFILIQEHHLGHGEVLSFRCPHCDKEVVVQLKALEGDPDTIEVYWGKNATDIAKKEKQTEKESQKN